MVFSTSTLLLIFLLLGAASLASYLLSQWTPLRDRIGWVGIGIGAMLLLAAALLVVVTTSRLSILHLWQADAALERGIGPASGDAEIAVRTLADAATPARALDASGRAAVQASRRRDEGWDEPSSSADETPAGGLAQAARESHGKAAAAATASELLSVSQEPWGATPCVRPFRPDPQELSRWTLENECDGPVAVLVATCSASESECDDPRKTLWSYPPAGLVLPWKLQRPVIHDEETVRGRLLRHAACLVTTRKAIDLIGESIEVRSTPEWREQFELVGAVDQCLHRARHFAQVGASSHQSIQVLTGVN